MTIKAIIVDDEPLARDVLHTYISKMPEIELVAQCESAIEANDILKREEIHLMFLDIQMPQISGIDFLKSLSNPPQVIFTTAYPDYALDGFELDAVDYLLKPISFDRFMKAVNKASAQLEKEGYKEDVKYFFVKADKKLVKVNYDDILYIEGLKDYVIIRQEDDRVITLQTMKSLEQKLPSPQFKRIHRSYIANVRRIEAIEGNLVHIKEKDKIKKLPIGKSYREELLEMINDNRL